MKTVIVFNHPNDGSYCNAILHSVTAGLQKANQEVDLIHLRQRWLQSRDDSPRPERIR